MAGDVEGASGHRGTPSDPKQRVTMAFLQVKVVVMNAILCNGFYPSLRSNKHSVLMRSWLGGGGSFVRKQSQQVKILSRHPSVTTWLFSLATCL